MPECDGLLLMHDDGVYTCDVCGGDDRFFHRREMSCGFVRVVGLGAACDRCKR